MTENLVPEENLNHKKSHFILFFLLLVVLLVALTGLVFWGNNKSNNTAVTTMARTPATSKIPKSVNMETKLSFSPSQQTVVVNETIKAPVLVSAGKNNLSAAQLKLLFDPKLVEIMDIIPGNFFTSPTVLLKNIDNQTGQAEFALGSLNSQSGENILATLTLKLISATPPAGTKISFSPDTKIADINEGSNSVLKSITDLTITSVVSK